MSTWGMLHHPLAPPLDTLPKAATSHKSIKSLP
jgi:hypothetical protein